jgi:hypothetical protein
MTSPRCSRSRGLAAAHRQSARHRAQIRRDWCLGDETLHSGQQQRSPSITTSQLTRTMLCTDRQQAPYARLGQARVVSSSLRIRAAAGAKAGVASAVCTCQPASQPCQHHDSGHTQPQTHTHTHGAAYARMVSRSTRQAKPHIGAHQRTHPSSSKWLSLSVMSTSPRPSSSSLSGASSPPAPVF